jgi:Zn-dependent protease/predicted transcriptional regulator
MTDTFRLGHIGGVRVGVNWTVLVIFLLLTFGLAAARFPAAFPGRSAGAYWTAALVAGIVFFGSLLAHEMGHALMARRHGLVVEGITLWLFGGVARIRGESPDPRTELRIAGVGPVISLLLGCAFGAVGLLLAALGVTGLPVGVFSWLAGINVLLAVFNSLPAAPLDGGRLLRALLWWRHGDYLRAAITAARAGRVFGYVLVGLGLVSFLLIAGLGGLWLALIGLFLAGAASLEEQQALARKQLGSLAVRDVMSEGPMVVRQDVSVAELVDRYVFHQRFSTFPTVDEAGRTVGLVTLNRVKEVPLERRDQIPVADIACPLARVPVADPDQPLADLLPSLGGCADGRALVLRDGNLIGIVSPTDVMRAAERAQLRGDAVHPRF